MLNIVVASITGDSALRIAERVNDKKIVCVTCPQGMYWEVEAMDKDLFAEIPELEEKKEWINKGLKRVPMNINDENRNRMEKLGIEIVRGTIPLFGPILLKIIYF